MAALTSIITDYCPDIFYKVLNDPDLGYANRTPENSSSTSGTRTPGTRTIIRSRFALMSGSSSQAYVFQKWTTNYRGVRLA